MGKVKNKGLMCVHENCRRKGKEQGLANFYSSNVDGMTYFPICKECIKKEVDPEDVISVKKVLKAMNYPFILQVWENSKSKEGVHPFGVYIGKMRSLAQYMGKGWEFGETSLMKSEEGMVEEAVEPETRERPRVALAEETIEELREEFGYNHSEEELLQMKKKYDALSKDYPDSPLHKESLITYVRYKVKEEMSTADGDSKSATEWGRLAQTQADRAKINPKQLSDKDLDEGLNSIATLALMVEKSEDIVALMPEYLETPRDVPDFILYCLVERVREEKGLPPITYREMYDWYDELVAAHVKEFGDPYGKFVYKNKKMRDQAEKFIEGATFDE